MLAEVSSAENLSIFGPRLTSAEAIRSLSLLVAGITAFIFMVVRRRAALFVGQVPPPWVASQRTARQRSAASVREQVD